jgi:hypothetical protein
MLDRQIYDCKEVIAIAYPGQGRTMPSRVHLAPVPRPGQALSHGVQIEGTDALIQLRKAIDHALKTENMRGGARSIKEGPAAVPDEPRPLRVPLFELGGLPDDAASS